MHTSPKVPTVVPIQVLPAPVICPIIVTKTYQQIQQTLELMVPPMVSGSLSFCPGDWSHPGSPEAQEALSLWHVVMVLRTTPILHLAFIAHLLQRADYVLLSAAGHHPTSGSAGRLLGPCGPPMILPPMAGPLLPISVAALRTLLEGPETPLEPGLGLGIGPEREGSGMVVAAAGLETSALVAMEAGGTQLVL